MDTWTQKKVDALRIERDAAAKSGNHFDALVINDRIRNLKCAPVNVCPSCGRQFIDGETCSRGGCPMGGDVLTDRTVFYEVADLVAPTAEPFMVVRIDVNQRREGGVEGIVQSLHWTREDAQQRADDLTKEGIACGVCGGNGFSGRGSNYGDVCGECGGLRYFP